MTRADRATRADGGGTGPLPDEPPDLRLAGLAIAAWLSALAGLHLSARAGATLAAAAAIAALVTVAAAGRRPPAVGRRWAAAVGRARWAGRDGWARIVAVVLFGVVCGSAATAARIAVRDAEPLAALVREHATVTADLVVRDDPRPVAGAAGRPPVVLLSAQLSELRPEGPRTGPVSVPARVLVLASHPGWLPLLPGQAVTVTGRLLPSRGGDLHAAVLSTDRAPVPRGRPSWAQRAAGSLRAGLQRACVPLPDEPGGLLPGLVVGDTSRLDPAVEEDFRATGMTHLVAVSGSNVAIVIGLVLLLARWARAGPWPAAAVSAVALVGFVILARPSPSVVRAAAMGAVGLLALAAGRPRAALPALGAAVTALVVLDPALAGDAGFALSVCATAGLLLIAPRWRDALRHRGVPAGAAEALAIPAAAQLACAPVVAALSGTVSLVAVPANLLAVPAIAPATVLGVAAAVLSPFWPVGAEIAAWLGGWPAWWLVTVARHGAQLPAGTLPWPDGVAGGLLLAFLSGVLLLAARRRLLRRAIAVLTVAVVVGALPVRIVAPGWPPPGWVLAVCAVGQGDAVVLPVSAGTAVVVDAGPDPAPVDRCLRRLGVRAVPLLVVSHFHADHVGGLAGVVRGREVGAVLTTAWPEPAMGRDAVHRMAAARAVPVLAATAGWSYRRGAVELTVVGPPGELTGTRSDPNNNSLVVSARVGGVTVLLAGDAESEEQRALLERHGAAGLRADVLKVAHHGSAYQETEFLDAISPAVALVSVGSGNRYGHPNVGVLARLTRGGARVLRTDVDGDLAAVRGDRGLAVAVRGADEPARR
ncbi:competence protein ComEC [Micromonospora pattaloongensis]|uniref:Competence protein ComEC n=1 Tax=Micromonospora pattaloongensis TaxID=405436 RepID=A0A1H3RMB8_9ACTN|nr:ComEC/Rec2 family competence protein [Micromonospora pattaloongensis]SDZ26368.1 competence protein ComEC [Micromonospora pattaloongensis]